MGAVNFFYGAVLCAGAFACACGGCGCPNGAHVARPFLGVVADPELAPAPLRSAAAGAPKAAAFQNEQPSGANPFTV